MNPKAIDDMGMAIADVYAAVTDRILINLAHHFPYVQTNRHIGSWEYQTMMLAQMGKVEKETIAIIAQSLGGADEALKQALETAILQGLKNEEPKLRQAAMNGLLKPHGYVPELDPSQLQAFTSYYKQSADKLNLVNTVMLDSTRQAYQATVADVAQKIANTQGILNAAAGEVVTGVSTWNGAMHSAVQKMVANGITGFIDHAGHKWSPEAYVAMDIKTTMFNTARAAVWERSEQYGSDLYQVSSHNGARPLCYPWQGKVLSRSGWTGIVKDIDGNEVQVHSQEEVPSFGYGGSLFGANCGHYPMTFIPNFSTLKGEPQDQATNDKQYAETQQQRALERKLREEKRDLEVMKAQGAPAEQIKVQRERVRNASADIDEFCDKTGLPRRRNRETAPVRAEWATPQGNVTRYNGDYIPTDTMPINAPVVNDKAPSITQSQTVAREQFVPANSIKEAVERAENDGVKYARFDSMTLERANNALEALETLPTDARPVAIANGRDISILTDRPLGRKADQWYGVTYDYRTYSLRTMQLGYERTDYNGGVLVGLNTTKFRTLEQLTKAKEAVQSDYLAKTGHEWFFNTDGKATAFHEMGHVYADIKGLPSGWEDLAQRWATESNVDMLKIPSEAFAEAWGAYHSNGRQLPSYIEDVIKGLK